MKLSAFVPNPSLLGSLTTGAAPGKLWLADGSFQEVSSESYAPARGRNH